MDLGPDQPMKCDAFVELVTEYLEATLSRPALERFVGHRELCRGCDAYVDQMRLTLQVAARLAEDSPPPSSLDRVLEVFRERTRSP